MNSGHNLTEINIVIIIICGKKGTNTSTVLICIHLVQLHLKQDLKVKVFLQSYAP